MLFLTFIIVLLGWLIIIVFLLMKLKLFISKTSLPLFGNKRKEYFESKKIYLILKYGFFEILNSLRRLKLYPHALIRVYQLKKIRL